MVRSHQFALLALSHEGSLPGPRPSTTNSRVTSSPASVPASTRSTRHSLFTILFVLIFFPPERREGCTISAVFRTFLRRPEILSPLFSTKSTLFAQNTPGGGILSLHTPSPRHFSKEYANKELKRGGVCKVCASKGLMYRKAKSRRGAPAQTLANPDTPRPHCGVLGNSNPSHHFFSFPSLSVTRSAHVACRFAVSKSTLISFPLYLLRTEHI